MVYLSTYVTEGIVFHDRDNVDEYYIIALTKNLDGKTFTVEVDFDEEYEWNLSLETPGNYEMVKHMMMELAFNCDNAEELIMEMENVFGDLFHDIVINECDEDCDCETGCGHCGCK